MNARRTLRTLLHSGALALSLWLSTPVWAAGELVPKPKAQRIEAEIQRNTQNKVRIQAIRSTPIANLFQVDSDGEVFFVDASGRFAVVGGAMIDLKNRTDLTAAHLDSILRVNFDALPLKSAIKEVHGNGSRKLAVFEDPNCPICRVFTKFLDQLDDVTIYRFMFPIVDPKSEPLARIAWCSPNRAAVWRDIMAGARPTGPQDCDTKGLVDIMQAGDKFHIQSTPTVFLGNGRRLIGATPPEQFMAELEASSQRGE